MYCNGTFNMRGGSISGGKCYNYTTGELNQNSANFNFFLVNGTLNISGGKIAGGAIFAEGIVASGTTHTTEVNISGGTINGGLATGYGGNIKVLANGLMEISGGTVKGGFIYKDDAMTQKNTSWRHSQVSSEGNFDMSGGRIEGSAYVTAGIANISGGAYVVGGCHLSVEPAANVTIGALNDKANVKFFFQENATDDTKSEYKTKWSEGSVKFATAGSELTEAMLNKISVGTYPVKTGRSFKAVLENGELFFRMITNP